MLNALVEPGDAQILFVICLVATKRVETKELIMFPRVYFVQLQVCLSPRSDVQHDA